MELIYLYNIYGHFRPKNTIRRNNDNFLVYLLSCEINYQIDPWLEFLENPKKTKVYGNLAALQKVSPEIVAILWRFDYLMDKEDYCAYFIQIPVLINIIKIWGKIISKQPKGILISFGATYDEVELIPDWKGNEQEMLVHILEKNRAEDDENYTEEYQA